jgi:L-ascorbate metabolism protein UlaG (beta-lactamase superfamily)
MRSAAVGACVWLSIVSPLAFGAGASAAGRVLAGDHISTSGGDLVVHTMKHATFALGWNGRTVFVDPVAGAQMRYEELPLPDLVLLTDSDADHLDVGQLQALVQKNTRIVAPLIVGRLLPPALRAKTVVLARGESTSAFGISVESTAATGAGNGYVLTFGRTRVYVSGDLEDPAELGALRGIDVAFVDFDEPPATTAEETAAAVRRLAPKFVYPYNYGNGDAVQFKALVGWSSDIEVRIRAWY